MKQLLFYSTFLFFSVCWGQSIKTIKPNEGKRNQGVTIVITCANMSLWESGQITCTLKSNVDGTQIAGIDAFAESDSVCSAGFLIPFNATVGDYSVNLKTTNHGTLTKAVGFIVTNEAPVPELTSINPVVGNEGQKMDITVTAIGTQFLQDTNIQAAFRNGTGDFIAPITIEVIDNTRLLLKVDIPLHQRAGLYSLLVYIGDELYSLGECFTVTGYDPRLMTLSPPTGKTGQTIDLKITGKGTRFTSVENIEIEFSRVWGWGECSSSSVTVENDTVIKVRLEIPEDAKTGPYRMVMHSNKFHGLELAQPFRILNNENNGPAILSVNPNGNHSTQVFDITVDAKESYFKSKDRIDLFIFNDAENSVYANEIIAIDDSKLKGTIDLGFHNYTGSFHLGIMADDSYYELLNCITLNTVGLAEKHKQWARIYPNPVAEKLYIETPKIVNTVTIIDITGKQTAIDKSEQYGNRFIVPIAALDLLKGLHMIKLESEDGVEYHKFLVE